jgi:hypothetical protein
MLKAIEEVLVKNRVQHSAVLAQEIADAIAIADGLDAPKPGDPPLDALIHNIVPTETPLLIRLNEGAQS